MPKAENEKRELNWEEDVRIDPEALDVEWIRQPRIFMEYAAEAARVRLEQDKQKTAVEVLRAEISTRVRQSPGSYGLEKVTESAVDGVVTRDVGYRAAEDLLHRLSFELDVMSSAIRAMDQRKAALENLVRLHAAGYFAGPSVPRNLPQEVERHTELERASTRDAVRGAMGGAPQSTGAAPHRRRTTP